MDYKKILEEYQKAAIAQVANQPLITVEQFNAQVEGLKSRRANTDNRKKRPPITDEEIQRILNETYGCDSI